MKLDELEFPECVEDCDLIDYFGTCECESFCPNKFDKNGSPIKFERSENKIKKFTK